MRVVDPSNRSWLVLLLIAIAASLPAAAHQSSSPMRPGPHAASSPADAVVAQAPGGIPPSPNTADVHNADDGARDAPTCDPQLPTLLQNYVVRPAWKVAGVDYCVGHPTNIALKDPSRIVDNVTIVGARKLVFGGRNYLVVSGNNVVVDG